MKALMLTLFLLTPCLSVKAQDSTDVKLASVHALGIGHSHLSLFIGYPGYKVLGDMQLYLQQNLSCKIYAKPDYRVLKDSSILSTTQYLSNIPDQVHKPITLTTITDKKGLIRSMNIKGDYVDVTMLFLFYWPTNISAAEVKQKKAAVSYLLTDKITYQATGSDQATITISHL